MCYPDDKPKNGYRRLWEIQQDGRYWAEEDGFGAENDSEIIPYAGLDSNGVFKGPFCIYSMSGIRIEEQESKGEHKTEQFGKFKQYIEESSPDKLILSVTGNHDQLLQPCGDIAPYAEFQKYLFKEKILAELIMKH